jgi:hypothetical protein
MLGGRTYIGSSTPGATPQRFPGPWPSVFFQTGCTGFTGWNEGKGAASYSGVVFIILSILFILSKN